MSLNTAHADHGVLIHAGECILIFSDNVSVEFHGNEGSEFKGTKNGRMYLTTHRMIFNSKNPSDAMRSFSFPFVALGEVSVEQPLFGANFIKGKVRAQPNGNWMGEVKFKLTFKSGGAIDFGQAMLKVAQMATRGMSSGTAPPPYTAPAGPWYAAAPPAYTPAPQGYYGWVPPLKHSPTSLHQTPYSCQALHHRTRVYREASNSRVRLTILISVLPGTQGLSLVWPTGIRAAPLPTVELLKDSRGSWIPVRSGLCPTLPGREPSASRPLSGNCGSRGTTSGCKSSRGSSECLL